MYKILVPEIMCQGCVNRINNTLSLLNIHFSISLEEKTVTVSADENLLKIVIEKIEDLGFTTKIL